MALTLSLARALARARNLPNRDPWGCFCVCALIVVFCCSVRRAVLPSRCVPIHHRLSLPQSRRRHSPTAKSLLMFTYSGFVTAGTHAYTSTLAFLCFASLYISLLTETQTCGCRRFMNFSFLFRVSLPVLRNWLKSIFSNSKTCPSVIFFFYPPEMSANFIQSCCSIPC